MEGSDKTELRTGGSVSLKEEGKGGGLAAQNEESGDRTNVGGTEHGVDEIGKGDLKPAAK